MAVHSHLDVAGFQSTQPAQGLGGDVCIRWHSRRASSSGQGQFVSVVGEGGPVDYARITVELVG